MARIKIERIFEKLETDLRAALADAVRNTIPEIQFDEHRLYREFIRSVGYECRRWERVPDQYVEIE